MYAPSQFGWVLDALIVSIIVLFLLRSWAGKKVSETHSHWHNHFENLEYSTQEFYALIQEKVTDKGIPNVAFFRVQHPEGSILSANRDYLRIQRGKLCFDICAAPFAKGFFVSWWMGDLPDSLRSLLNAIPFIGRLIDKAFYTKTYYKIDTEQMFRVAVHQCVVEAVSKITSAKGIPCSPEIGSKVRDHLAA